MSLLQSLRRLWGGSARPGEPSIATVSSSGWDPAFGGVGSSPAKGDLGSSYLLVPGPPGEYLFRLCAFYVEPGYACRVVSFAQYADLAITVPLGDDGTPYPLYRQIVSPMWRPTGGSIAWGLTTQPDLRPRQRETPSAGRARDTSLQGYAPALLVQPPPAALTVPLTRGLWPGSPIGDMGVFRDMRSPWGRVERMIDYAVEGGSTLTLWAWVKQRDPSLYPALVLPEGAEPGALSDEDRFLLSFPGAVYGRIAGRLTLELYPDTGASRRENL